MFIENPEALKTWLKNMLRKISDADPEALAKYILALVKKDKCSKTLKTFLLEQLEVFLIDETNSFVDLLISALVEKKYLVASGVGGVGSPIISSPSKSNLADSSQVSSPKEEAATNKTNSMDTSTDKLQYSRAQHNTSSRKRRNDFDKDKSQPSKKYPVSSKDSYSIKTGREKNTDEKDKRDGKSTNIRSRSSSVEKTRKSRSRSKSPRERRPYKGVGEHSTRDYKTKSDFSKKQHFDPLQGDADYREKRQNADLSTTNIPFSISPTKNNGKSISYSTKDSKRCKDYDEKGYCLKGVSCYFDHGLDPILVEHVSALNFPHVTPSSDEFEVPDGTQTSPLPPLPSSPPKIPPPPPPLPPPSTGTFLPEPYNPESPGMNMITHITPNNHLNYYLPLPEPPRIPPPPPYSRPPPPIIPPTPHLMYGEPFHNPNPRQRELIGVPTIDSSCMALDNTRSKNDQDRPKSLISVYDCGTGSRDQQSTNLSEFKPKRFDFSRLGSPCLRNCLEIRKIPKSLNTIANLAKHFSKFGNIVNIEVVYDNDPEAAKITFQTNREATAAYRSTEPILNNRFIKVFYHNPNPRHDFGKGPNTTFSNETNTKEASPDINIGTSNTLDTGISEESKEDVRYPSPSLPPAQNAHEKNFPDSKRNMSRSVFVSSSQVAKRKSLSTHTFKKGLQDREALINNHKKKKLELYHAKVEFIKAQIQHQKIILDQLLKCKSSKEKEFLKMTLDKISETIKEANKDIIKKHNEDLKSLLKGHPQVAISKTAAKKQLLDAELELYIYNKQQHVEEEDSSELLSKVNDILGRAKALGIVENSPQTPKYTYRRYGNNSRYHPNSKNASLSIDHRPRKILVIGSPLPDKEVLKRHFKKFGDIEEVEEMTEGIVFTFSTRKEAEAAYACGGQFEENRLTLSWFSGSQLSAIPNTDFNNEDPELKPTETQLGEVDEEEEEEEEDSEARSWRR